MTNRGLLQSQSKTNKDRVKLSKRQLDCVHTRTILHGIGLYSNSNQNQIKYNQINYTQIDHTVAMFRPTGLCQACALLCTCTYT